MKFLLLLLLPFLLLASTNSRALYLKKYHSESKTALVIGNSNYQHFSKLKNSKNDAYDMSQVLKRQGFDVLYLKNGSLKAMKKIVRKFSQKLRNGGVGFFYYAGHGVEVNGKNYLIPTNAQIPEKNEVEYEALSMNMIIDKMEDSNNRLNIVVLDACRNDPFSRSGGGGLAQINNAKGMYIAYATSPGSVASDGRGRNGLFTKHLMRNIQHSNLTLNEVFKNTRSQVYRDSQDTQLPWTSSSVIGDFYFNINKKSATAVKTRQTTPYIPEKKHVAYDTVLWNEIKSSSAISDFEFFLKKYPDSQYSDIARLKIARLSQQNKPKRVTRRKDSSIIIHETFSNNNNAWHENDNEKVSIKVAYGKYVFAHKREKRSWMAWKTFNQLSQNDDYEISFDAEHISGINNNSFGLMFGAKDAKNTYWFGISNNGYYQVGKFVDGTWSNLQKWSKDTIIKIDKINHLALVKRGSRIEFYINDKKCTSLRITEFFGKKIGMHISKNQTIEFDNFKILKH